MRVLIVESSPPFIEQVTLARGQIGNAEYYGRSLQQCDSRLEIDVARPYEGNNMPDLSNYDGAVFTGSSAPWATNDVRAWPIQQAMEKIFEAGLPCIGSCNGLQLATVVLGGRVGASPNGLELGVARDIRLTKAGSNHLLHQGRSATFVSPCVHRDEVRQIPAGAVITATNDHSQVQAMVYEKGGVSFWGMQYHPEATLGLFAGYINDPDSPFSGTKGLAADLLAADVEPEGESARRLGAVGKDLTPSVLRTELVNWLGHIQG